MNKPSLTGSETFGFRVLRSEATRSLFMAAVYTALIIIALIRRAAGGVVMTDGHVFLPYVGILTFGVAYQLFCWNRLRTALKRAQPIAGWKLTAGAAIELAIPAIILLVMHIYSPRGAYAALSGPSMLLFPLTIMLSVLRLRPRASLWFGLAAAACHAALSIATVIESGLDAHQYPVLLTYSALLALGGVGAMLVSRAMRRYVTEAVEESQAREQAGLKLARVEHDLEVARQIQNGLLPSGSPAFDGFEIAGMNKPADQTGGDYYDWQPLPDGRLMVVMADVTGHGIGPALVMAVCRAYARASAPLDTNPASLMARLNDLMHADLSAGRFVTLAMAMLDTGGHVELVSAGHGPTMLYRAAGGSKGNGTAVVVGTGAVGEAVEGGIGVENLAGLEQFWGDGLPLAVAGSQEYGPSRMIAMEKGDLLVMLTDGVMEWQNAAGKQFGPDRIAAAISAVAGKPAAEIVDHIHRSVLDFAAGTKQNDDVTIVVIKRTR